MPAVYTLQGIVALTAAVALYGVAIGAVLCSKTVGDALKGSKTERRLFAACLCNFLFYFSIVLYE